MRERAGFGPGTRAAGQRWAGATAWDHYPVQLSGGEQQRVGAGAGRFISASADCAGR